MINKCTIQSALALLGESIIDGYCDYDADICFTAVNYIDELQAENRQLQSQLTAKETTLNGTYIDINTHYRDIEKLQSENTRLKAERDKAVEDMKSIVDSVREEHCDETCCFACKFDCDTSITDSGSHACECPGFERGDCFEWRGLESQNETE